MKTNGSQNIQPEGWESQISSQNQSVQFESAKGQRGSKTKTIADPRPLPSLSEKDKERFFGKIATNPNDRGCLEWIGYCSKKGYGKFTVGLRRLLAHRVALSIRSGLHSSELDACHSCDNPKCCNPSHLFWGTHKDNMDDMNRKGRCKNRRRGNNHPSRLYIELRPRGENHGMARLKSEDIPIIRSDTRKHHEIAADYGVTRRAICSIKQRITWKHIP